MNLYISDSSLHRKADVITSHHNHIHGLDDIPKNEGGALDTIHFQLSHQQEDRRPPTQEEKALQQQLLAASLIHAYSGPQCYVKPKAKSNVKIVRNAICAVCLAGEVNMSLKQKTLAVSVQWNLYIFFLASKCAILLAMCVTWACTKGPDRLYRLLLTVSTCYCLSTKKKR